MSRAARGYLLVAGSFLIMGLIGALVEWATAPESALLVLRFATAGIVLGIVFARRRPLAGAAARSVWPRLLLMGVIDAFTLLLFFVAIRGTSVAIGIAMGPEHGLNAADLLHHASVAQHQAAESKVKCLIYRAEADPHRPEQLSLMSDMRRGLKTGEFELRYQPKLDLRTQKIIGAEAVVRWNHLSRGQLAPDAFIGLAEHTGNIQLLTYWVIQNTLKQMSEWKDIGFELKIAVNVSVRDLEDSGLYDNIICLLENYRVNFHDFTLEITESAVMSEPTAAVQVLTRLANSGIGLSIDDFGTGHAALSYLRHLPVREIKIDKSFILDLIRNAGDQTIVKAIVELGHALNYTVTAEGVEDSQSLEILRALRCDAVQGYLISKPLRAGDFLDVVRSWNEAPATAGRIAAVRP